MPVRSKKVALFLEKCHLLHVEYEKFAKVKLICWFVTLSTLNMKMNVLVCHLVHLVSLDHNMVLVDQLSSVKQLQGEKYL